MLTETITWHPVIQRLPDDEMTGLIAMDDDREPVWMGYRYGLEWIAIDGNPLSTERVTHWADMPGGPQR